MTSSTAGRPLASAALQRVADLVGLVDPDAQRAHRLGDGGEARVREVAADVAVGVVVDLVLLLGTPLAVVEHHGHHRDVLAHGGEGLVQAHAPGTVADVGDRGALGAAILAPMAVG
jgi:hypothetical protein